MTREELIELWPVLTAFKDGADIQCRRTDFVGNWNAIVDDPTWTVPDTEYRVKPVPQTREVWVNVYEAANSTIMHASKVMADASVKWPRIACVPVTINFTEGEGLGK